MTTNNEVSEQEVQLSRSNREWEAFVHGRLIAFMQANGIDNISVSSNGQKAKVKKNANGEWKTQLVFEETI